MTTMGTRESANSEATVWACGQTRANTADGQVWEFQGVFSTEALAVAACRNKRYFVAPVEIDVPMDDETFVWPGCYFPLA